MDLSPRYTNTWRGGEVRTSVLRSCLPSIGDQDNAIFGRNNCADISRQFMHFRVKLKNTLAVHKLGLNFIIIKLGSDNIL